MNVWGWKGFVKCLCSLRFVIVDGCYNLEYIFLVCVVRMLEKFEDFFIFGCYKIDEVFLSEVEGIDDIIFYFLRELVFCDLSNLEIFWFGVICFIVIGNIWVVKFFFNDKVFIDVF